MENRVNCPVCDAEISCNPDYHRDLIFYSCPLCGRYELAMDNKLNLNRLAPYLFYNSFKSGLSNGRYHTALDKETCDKYREEYDKGDHRYGRPVHMDADVVDNWYPKTFSERIDKILLLLDSRIKHIGQRISMSYQELLSAFFIDRKEFNSPLSNDVDSCVMRSPGDCQREIEYMINYLIKCSYIDYIDGVNKDEYAYISLTPEGYARVEMLQKNTAHGRNVLVAMKFGEDTRPLREAIRKGIEEAGYTAIFIDEVQHNDFITPELLKYIRDSKFVVVDLTHQNNGAYFEEGYAMGLGKPVIQLCKENTILHFDIAQKNTIMWSTEDDIPIRLCNRIKATID